jgi:RecB family endonuclease NucS
MSYNKESDLTLVIALAYYAAREYYHVKREFPSGHGYADVAFVPRKGCSVLPMIVELKWERSSDDAISQIYKKKYLDAFKSEYKEAIVCGINYTATDKEHTCRIEKVALK